MELEGKWRVDVTKNSSEKGRERGNTGKRGKSGALL